MTQQISAASAPDRSSNRAEGYAPADSHCWLGTAEFAATFGMTRQAAARTLRGAKSGDLWRGQRLEVRSRQTRGGRRGLAYEVNRDSLPTILPAIGTGEDEPLKTSTAAAGREKLVAGRWDLIQTALEHPRGSLERARAVTMAAFGGCVSERTLYRWIQRYEVSGLRGLGRVRPPNAAEPRVWVSRVFDRACVAAGYDEDRLADITRELEKALKGLWASRAEQAGATEVQRLAQFLLLEICEAKRVVLSADAMRLSRRYVERFAHYRVVNQRRNDRKAFDDAKPRIRRDWTMLAPMERVVADVKHLDVVVSRDDGSLAWPKIVAFLDAGTGRVFVHPIMLDLGEGVRQEHVIEAFLAMVAKPRWGFPQGLYLDNGSEFGAFGKIDGALQSLNQSGARTLIFARPYNAAAKPIESLFARLDRYVFCMLPGYAGPNRMAKKTQTVGKPPQPYPGPWEEFCDTVLQLIDAHNHRPVGGFWSGRSPEDWMTQKVNAGWRPALVDTDALDAAFSDSDSRRVDRGVLKINGKRYSHPDIAALPSRTVVDLALPWRRGATPLARVGAGWFYLEEDLPYPARWVEGAKESTRRQTSQAKHVKGLAKDAPKLDPITIKLREAGRRHASARISGGPVLDLGGSAEELGRDAALGRMAQASARSKEDERLTREMLITERLEKRQRQDG